MAMVCAKRMGPKFLRFPFYMWDLDLLMCSNLMLLGTSLVEILEKQCKLMNYEVITSFYFVVIG